MLKMEETTGLMLSDNYKDRFLAEYIQTKIRCERLNAFLTKIEAANRTVFADVENGEIRVGKPDHNCPEHLLRDQLYAMREYLHILEIRAVNEGINLQAVME